MEHIGKAIIFTGILLVIVGLALTFWERIPLVGKLPGDFHFKRGNFHFYFPLVTSLLLSAVLTLILWIAIRISRR